MSRKAGNSEVGLRRKGKTSEVSLVPVENHQLKLWTRMNLFKREAEKKENKDSLREEGRMTFQN